jgi:hypothetical protein
LMLHSGECRRLRPVEAATGAGPDTLAVTAVATEAGGGGGPGAGAATLPPRAKLASNGLVGT